MNFEEFWKWSCGLTSNYKVKTLSGKSYLSACMENGKFIFKNSKGTKSSPKKATVKKVYNSYPDCPSYKGDQRYGKVSIFL